MIRNALGKRITRRKFAKTVGAAALGTTVPGLATARTTKPTADRQNALDHVVVIMFENRSFNNVLGRLYAPGEVASFEGVIGKDLRNPIPDWAENGADRKFVPYGIAANMNTPHPDPGEEYPHINTDLFGVGDPRNRFMPLAKMVAPYNAPAPGEQPTMDGFVADYISAFTAEKGRQPTYEQYAQIMTGYTPDQMPVTSTLTRAASRLSIIGSAKCLRRRLQTVRSSMRQPHPALSSTIHRQLPSQSITRRRRFSSASRQRALRGASTATGRVPRRLQESSTPQDCAPVSQQTS